MKKTIFTLSVIVLLVGITIGFIFLKRGSIFPGPKNVLFILVDALRPDHLSCYGYQRHTSPHIDKLAEEGVRFTQTIAQAIVTFGSFPSIISSTYLHTNGIRSWGDQLDSSVPNLIYILRKNGFRIGLFTSHSGSKELIMDSFIIKGDVSSDIEIFGEAKAEEVTQSLIRWLETNRNKRFFALIHYLDPHAPYLPPARYKDRYINDDLYNYQNENVPLAEESDPLDATGVIPKHVIEDDITDKNYYISQYDAEINYSDEQVGILLKALKDLDLDKNTLIILFADHGESLGEHNFYFSHGGYLYDVLIKVPLIIRYSPLIPSNKVITTQVELIDMVPTVLDLLNIKIPKMMEGVSLLPLITTNKGYYKKYAFSEFYIGSKYITASIRTQRWKLIRNFNSDEVPYELYDLKEDPGELNNIVSKKTRGLTHLKERLRNWMRQAKKQSHRPIHKLLDEETKEALRSLGYAQ